MASLATSSCAIAIVGGMASCSGEERCDDCWPEIVPDAKAEFLPFLDAGGENLGRPDVCPNGVGRRRRIAVATQHGCALRTDGRIVCWGTPVQNVGQARPPTGGFTEVSLRDERTCGIGVAGGLACWGRSLTVPPLGAVGQVSVGTAHVCVLQSCGDLVCFGEDNSGATQVPAASYVAVAAGDSHTCAVRDNGSLLCWGDNRWRQASPPSGTFTMVATELMHGCAIRTDNSLACWGMGSPGQPVDGSDPDGASWGQATPPAGQFKDVSTGRMHSCAVQIDGQVRCWGAGTTLGNCQASVAECGQSMPPPDLFEEVAAGFTHSCGIRADGKIACWGSTTGGRSTPPTDFQ